ncbi:MAG TPA: hypothetical protein VGN49_09760 [Micrococcaceae bacterium]|jgi:hypothetical protein|nr:hypothetical protein [Micrococcaceae bacterium]
MNKLKKSALGGLALAAVIGGGALTAAALPANAAETVASSSPSSSSTTPGTTAAGSTGQGAPDPSKGGHQANGITEQLLTGDTAAKVKAAALAANPGATIQRVENDAEGATYEAHILKSDGTPATVKLDASFNVTGTETGGPGGGQAPPSSGQSSNG